MKIEKNNIKIERIFIGYLITFPSGYSRVSETLEQALEILETGEV